VTTVIEIAQRLRGEGCWHRESRGSLGLDQCGTDSQNFTGDRQFFIFPLVLMFHDDA
jgi:hypothetical protein